MKVVNLDFQPWSKIGQIRMRLKARFIRKNVGSFGSKNYLSVNLQIYIFIKKCICNVCILIIEK